MENDVSFECKRYPDIPDERHHEDALFVSAELPLIPFL